MKKLNEQFKQLDIIDQEIKSKFYKQKINKEYTAQIYDQGEGETILFTPVFENTSFIYARQIKELEKKYRVITYTRRESITKSFDANTLANDLYDLMKFLKLSNVRVVTTCITCTVALLVSIKDPGLIKSFFISNAFVYMPLPKFKIILAKFALGNLPDRFAKKHLVKFITSKSERPIFLYNFLKVKNAGKKFFYGAIPILKTDIRKELLKIKQPTYVLTTGYDPFIKTKYTKMIHECIEGSTFEIINNLKGHFISLLDPDLFLEKLNSFFNKN